MSEFFNGDIQSQLDELDNLRYKFDKLEDAYGQLSLDNQKLLKNLKETNESLQSKENELQKLRSELPTTINGWGFLLHSS